MRKAKNWLRAFIAGPIGYLVCISCAFAVIATAAEIAEALRNSPSANQLLRNNAAAVGALAMFESRGDTAVYNGTCCYGVLQMTATNIAQAGYTPAQFRQLSVQAQVNAWAAMQSQALNDPVVSQLRAMGTFDGQTVDFAFLLSCVQLGQGNCRRMVDSGRCSGFADSNGTTICRMADRTRTHMGIADPTAPAAGTPGAGSTRPLPPSTNPAWDVGSDEAFSNAAGTGSGDVASSVRSMMSALLLLLTAAALMGNWQIFTRGDSSVTRFMSENQRAILVLLLGALLLTL